MTTEQVTRDAFASQAEACERLGSPFTARLLRLAGTRLEPAQGPVAERMLSWPGDPSYNTDALALRFAAGLHALVLSGRDANLAATYPPSDLTGDEALWRAVTAAMTAHEAQLQHWLDSPPQTNEVRRAAVLYLGLVAIARACALPIALNEIGSSGGLNLNLDRFAHRFGRVRAGAPESRVVLAPEWRGPEPELDEPSVTERRGCDIWPLDPADAEARLRLLSYIWADQAERLALTKAALAIAEAHPPPLEQRDAAHFVAERLAAPSEGCVRVIAHTVMWQYMPATTQEDIRARIAQAGAAATAERPLAWLRMEPDGDNPWAALDLTLWPGGGERRLARCDFHGRWIEPA